MKNSPKYFCLNSGGCGSVYLTKLLKVNGLEGVAHDAQPDLNMLGIKCFLGTSDKKRGIAKLLESRKNTSVEIGNRLFSLVPYLKEAFPTAKFIHLHRDGRESVRSIASNPNIDAIFNDKIRFRSIGETSSRSTVIPTYSKICLYWSNINDRIINDTRGTSLLRLDFQDLISGKIENLEEFLKTTLQIKKIEPANQKPKVHGKRLPPFNTWDDQKKRIFWRLCGKTMLELGYWDGR